MDQQHDPREEEISPERFDPSFGHHIWYEHWHRYHWASRLTDGKVVADVACGEGYGSDLLAGRARRAIGIDADRVTLEAARRKYGRESLAFIHGDARALPLADDSIDLLVSFETLEHLAQQERMIAEIARVTRSDGLAIISTPDRELYSPEGVTHNEHHVSELSAAEFHELLGRFFGSVRTFGQQFQLLSVIEEVQAKEETSAGLTYADSSGARETGGGPGEHVYLIAVCGQSDDIVERVALPRWHGFNDSKGRLLAHYETQIRRLMDVDAELGRTRRQLRESQAAAAHLAARLGY